MFSRLDPSLKVFGALIIIIVACLATLPCISSYQANATLHALQDGAKKERAYNLALSLLKDAETGQRGFLIGSDESFLDPYNAGVAGIPAALEDLQRPFQLIENANQLAQRLALKDGRRRARRDGTHIARSVMGTFGFDLDR